MFTHEGSTRTFTHNAWLAIALSSVAGAVNTIGFFAVGSYTSHVTGNATQFADGLAQGRYGIAYDALALVGFFFAGAVTAATFVHFGKRFGGARFVAALLFEALLLAAFAFLSYSHPRWHLNAIPSVSLTGLLCFAMGLQNALVTNISGAVVRTTHLTGIVTDFGIEFVRLTNWLWNEVKGRKWHDAIRHAIRVRFHPNAHKAWLHLCIFGSFITGGILGPLLYFRLGPGAMFVPAGALGVLTGWDLAGALRKKRVDLSDG